jgi:hypothetical protein
VACRLNGEENFRLIVIKNSGVILYTEVCNLIAVTWFVQNPFQIADTGISNSAWEYGEDSNTQEHSNKELACVTPLYLAS